jgi:formylglycine-generating enzyme required for sulfatase activity
MLNTESAKMSDHINDESASSPDNDELAEAPEYLRLRGSKLREYLDARFATDAELDAFCIDHYNEVHRQFAAGMSRQQKLNLLIQVISSKQRQNDPKSSSRRNSKNRGKKSRPPLTKKLTPMVLGAIISDWLRRLAIEYHNALLASGSIAQAVSLTVIGGAAVATGAYIAMDGQGPNPSPKKQDMGTLGHPSPDLSSSDYLRDLQPGDDFSKILDIKPTDKNPDLHERPIPKGRQDMFQPDGSFVKIEDMRSSLDMSNAADLFAPRDLSEIALNDSAPPKREVANISMITIEPGSIRLLSATSESIVRTIDIKHRFQISKYEITQEQYKSVTGLNPSRFRGKDTGNYPVESITWIDAVNFCNTLSKLQKLRPCYELTGSTVKWMDGASCIGYRLPSEDEWVYSAYSSIPAEYAGGQVLDQLAWFSENSNRKTHAVGGKMPNAWRLFDMSGNVSEWLWDHYLPEHQGSAYDISDLSTTMRAVRGGSYFDDRKRLSVSRRQGERPQYKSSQIGLRVVISLH